MCEALNSINIRNKLITKVNETLVFTAYFRLRTQGWKVMQEKGGSSQTRESGRWKSGQLKNIVAQ